MKTTLLRRAEEEEEEEEEEERIRCLRDVISTDLCIY
jgi:hypothetical protein